VDKEILQFCVARRSEAPLARTPRTAVKEQRTKIKEQRTSEGVKEMRGREEAGEGGVEGGVEGRNRRGEEPYGWKEGRAERR